MKRKFILDKIPRFSDGNVTIDGHRFELINVNGNGAYFVEYSENGLEKDEVSFTKQAMKALFLLLTTK